MKTQSFFFFRWYIKHQIYWFFISSILALVSTMVCLGVTSFGIEMKRVRLQRQRLEFLQRPYTVSYNEDHEEDVTVVVTANIFINTFLELFWSLLSVKVSFGGLRSKEYDLRSDPKLNIGRNIVVAVSTSPNASSSSDQLATYGSRTTPSSGISDNNNSSSGKSKFVRREYILNDPSSSNLPPGYSSASGVLANPDFTCHLTDSNSRDFHVARANPLCYYYYYLGNAELPSLGTMSREDKVRRFLNLAAQTADETSRTLTMDPSHTYRSAVA